MMATLAFNELTDKEIVRESARKAGKTARPSRVVSEMVKAAGDTEVDMIAHLVNQVIVEVIPAKCELSIREKVILSQEKNISD